MFDLTTLHHNYGLKTVRTCLAKSKDEAIGIANNIGYPVALKIDSPDILHKSDVGGVCLNITNNSELRSSYEEIINSVEANCPSAHINGVLIQEMIPKGLEIIIGYTRDKVFGPTIMMGMGGIFTEAFKDVVFRALPLNKTEAGKMIEDLKFSELLLNGFRNFNAVDKSMIIDIILKVADFAKDNLDNLKSFDINPVTFFNNDYRIVDFKCILSNGDVPLTHYKPDITYIDVFFNAKKIAIVGASSLEDRIGYLILESILSSGYKGNVFCVNPKYKKIMDMEVYPSLLDIKSDIDVAVITISLKAVPDILDQCKQKGVKNVIIISAGGKETGNFAIENDIKKKAKDYSIRIIGCNCLGIFDGHSKIDTLFQPYSNMKRPGAGNISLISQSGTVGIASLELLEDYGISKFVSYGNRIDIDEGDLIKYLADDINTEVISIYIEGLEKGRKFYNSAKRASLKKPVIVYKAARSENASKAAISHTGFLSGTHNVIEGIMKQAGIIQVDNLVSFIAASKILSVYKKVKNNRVQIITNGAGAIIQAIDRIDLNKKLRLAKFSKEALQDLEEKLPAHMIIGNPIDLTGTATDEQYEISIRAAVNDKNIDLIMVFFVFQCKPITEKIANVLSKYKSLKPIICGTMGEEHTRYMGDLIENINVPVFYSIDEWVSAAEVLVI
jgi:3-hydroxypropionyl-CoA synthetase (ADP-forming)